MRYLITLLLIACVIAGCCNRCKNTSTTRFHEDGRAKPVATVPTMIDTTAFDVPWSLSEELTTSIAQKVAQGGNIYVKSQEDYAISENPFNNDLSWMKGEFQNHEFVVFLELVEHEFAPIGRVRNASIQEVSHNLNMSVRVRVIDLRGSQPKIVLQEMIRDSYFIPKTLFPTDYGTIAWGSEEYKKSPMGIAHNQITQTIAARISDYIILAKSR